MSRPQTGPRGIAEALARMGRDVGIDIRTYASFREYALAIGARQSARAARRISLATMARRAVRP